MFQVLQLGVCVSGVRYIKYCVDKCVHYLKNLNGIRYFPNISYISCDTPTVKKSLFRMFGIKMLLQNSWMICESIMGE